MFFKKGKQEDVNIVHLAHAHNAYELGMIKAILEENDIPYLTKEEGSGQYMRLYTGHALTGTDILVAEPAFEKAKELMISIGTAEK